MAPLLYTRMTMLEWAGRYEEAAAVAQAIVERFEDSDEATRDGRGGTARAGPDTRQRRPR